MDAMFLILTAVVFGLLAANAAWRGLPARAPDPTEQLRALLVERAAGGLSAEEFERAQARVHADLLSPPRARRRASVLRLFPFAAAVIGAGLAMVVVSGESRLAPSVAPAGGPGTATPPTNASAPAAAPAAGDLDPLARQLAAKLAKEPEDGPGWLLLARTYVELRRFPEADTAYAQAERRIPGDAALYTEWAEARLNSGGGQWEPRTKELLSKALSLPNPPPRAYLLAAREADARGDPRTAQRMRDRLRELAPPGSPELEEARAGIAPTASGTSAR